MFDDQEQPKIGRDGVRPFRAMLQFLASPAGRIFDDLESVDDLAYLSPELPVVDFSPLDAIADTAEFPGGESGPAPATRNASTQAKPSLAPQHETITSTPKRSAQLTRSREIAPDRTASENGSYAQPVPSPEAGNNGTAPVFSFKRRTGEQRQAPDMPEMRGKSSEGLPEAKERAAIPALPVEASEQPGIDLVGSLAEEILQHTTTLPAVQAVQPPDLPSIEWNQGMSLHTAAMQPVEQTMRLIDSLADDLLGASDRNRSDNRQSDDHFNQLEPGTKAEQKDLVSIATRTRLQPTLPETPDRVERIITGLSGSSEIEASAHAQVKPVLQSGAERYFDADRLASLVNDVLAEQARRNGVDLS